MDQYRPLLVVVDTFQKFTRVRDISDYAIVTNAMDPITSLARESGAHVAFTHHGTKSQCSDPGDVSLGSTALFGGVDTLIYMRKTESHRTIGSIQRYGDDLPETVIVLEPSTWTVALAGLKADADRNAAGQAIFEFLRARGTDAEPLDESAIREAVEGRRGTWPRPSAISLRGGVSSAWAAAGRAIPIDMRSPRRPEPTTPSRSIRQILVPSFPSVCGNQNTNREVRRGSASDRRSF